MRARACVYVCVVRARARMCVQEGGLGHVLMKMHANKGQLLTNCTRSVPIGSQVLAKRCLV